MFNCDKIIVILVLNIVVTDRIYMSSFCDDSDDVTVQPKHACRNIRYWQIQFIS